MDLEADQYCEMKALVLLFHNLHFELPLFTIPFCSSCSRRSSEAIQQNKYSTKSDCWSFGILLYEIWTRGEMPYKDMNVHQVSIAVVSGYRLPCPANCSESVFELMTACWAQEPNERPFFDDIHQHFRELEHELGKRGSQESLIAVGSDEAQSHEYVDFVRGKATNDLSDGRARLQTVVPGFRAPKNQQQYSLAATDRMLQVAETTRAAEELRSEGIEAGHSNPYQSDLTSSSASEPPSEYKESASDDFPVVTANLLTRSLEPHLASADPNPYLNDQQVRLLAMNNAAGFAFTGVTIDTNAGAMSYEEQQRQQHQQHQHGHDQRSLVLVPVVGSETGYVNLAQDEDSFMESHRPTALVLVSQPEAASNTHV